MLVIIVAIASPGFNSARGENGELLTSTDGASGNGRISLRLDHPLASSQAFRPDVYPATGTFNVLAIMVQFQPETDSLISGNGQFDMTPDSGLDAAPHNKTYFENHLLFLKNYFYRVSDGRVNINYTVLDSVITLPHEMKYYSPPSTDTTSADNMGLLFNDSWHAADSIYKNFNFSQYQCFVIFHAGSGRDIDFTSSLGYNPLPYDIPSVYLNLASLRKMFGSGYDGEPVDGGNFRITNSIIMPEWEDFPIVSLRLGTNGLLAASFGSFLGLPDLFDTKTGVTGIGRFGLEDGQAIFAYGGLFPPEPCAWEKAYLGWVTPEVATPSTTTPYQLYADGTGKYSILKVPISGTEYFLLENRERDPLRTGQDLTTFFDGRYDSIRYNFIQDTTYFDGQQVHNINGVVTDAALYDWALPGDTGSTASVQYEGGILIWHIDQNVIDQNLTTNTINANPNHRGVELEEAIGTNEIGASIQTILGSYYYDGSAFDFWFQGNPIPSYSNEFSPTSLPNSDSYSGANSHVYITDFGNADSVMTFDIRVGDSNVQPTAGFPKNIHDATTNSSPAFGYLSSDGKLQVVANNGDSLYAFNMDGSSAVSDTTGLLSRSGGEFQPILSSNLPASNLIYTMNDSVLYGYQIAARNVDTAFVTVASNAPSGIDRPLLEMGSKLIAFQKPFGSFSVFYTNGSYVGTFSTPQTLSDPVFYPSPVLADVAASDTNSFYFTAVSSLVPFYKVTVDVGQPSSTGIKYEMVGSAGPLALGYAELSQSEGPDLITLEPQSGILNFSKLGTSSLNTFSISSSDTIISGPIVADLNGDGNRDLIFATQTKVYAVNYAGAVLNGFPISTVGSESLPSGANRIVGSIAVADLNGDGKPEIIFGTEGGEIYAYTGSTARLYPGFPLSIGGPLAGSPAVAYDSQTGNLYLAAIGLDGYLYCWTFKGTSPSQVVWGNLLGNNYHTNSVTSPLAVQPPPASQTLMPTSEVYNWPNPVTNGLTKIHFYLRDNARVSITIYSFAGDKVADLDANGVGGIANEVAWNAEGVQSGVYFARVQAISSNTKAVAIIKIAVVK